MQYVGQARGADGNGINVSPHTTGEAPARKDGMPPQRRRRGSGSGLPDGGHFAIRWAGIMRCAPDVWAERAR